MVRAFAETPISEQSRIPTLAGSGCGVVDAGIAAVSVHFNATVLNYDRGFDHISGACPQLKAQWVVPR